MAKGKKPNKKSEEKPEKVRRSPAVPKSINPPREPVEENAAPTPEAAPPEPQAVSDSPESAETLKDVGREAFEQGREIAQDWEERLNDSVRQRPIYSLLIALGVGWLVGLLFFSGNRRD